MGNFKNWQKIRFRNKDISWSYYPFLFPLFNELFQTREYEILRKIDDLTKSIILLSINVMRADNSIHSREANVLRSKLIELFPTIKIKDLDYLLKAYYNKFRNSPDSQSFKFSAEVLPGYINKEIRDKSVKNHISYFLCEIAMADKVFKKEEKEMLLKLFRNLGLTDMDIARLFAFFDGRVDAINFSPKHRWEIPKKKSKKKKKKQTKRKQRIIRPANSQYKFHSALIILGVTKNSSSTQIKRAYKKLVMQYHPDRFVNQPIRQQDKATEMFIKIQAAYELVKRVKKFN